MAAMGPVTIFADPGKYDFLSCEQLIMQRKLWGEREVELRLLMDKGGAKRRRRSCERRRLPS
jgi:hypothetical protein